MSQQPNEIYEFGTFRLDRQERLLQRDGATISLTPKAFDLLLALVERHGRLVEKDELLKLVWPDAFVEEANLTYNISFIRKALGDGENGHKFIETVPKRGYRFVAEVREVASEPARDLPTAALPASAVLPEAVRPGEGKQRTEAIPTLETAAMLNRGGVRAYRAYRIWAMATAALLLAALAFAWAYFRRTPAESHATYTYLPWPEKTSPSFELGSPTISPDGRRVAFTAETEGVNHIWLYSLDAPEPVRLQGTEGARYPFWSPDGRNLGFFSGGKLKRIEASGGTAEALSDAPLGFGGAWSSAGVILFAPAQTGSGLYRVPDKGGERTSVTTLDTARFEYQHNFPRFLPDGRHFVFFTRSSLPENNGIRLGSLDQPQTSFLLRADANAEYSEAGYLLLMRGRKILAQPFDAAKLTLKGEPVTLAEQGSFLIPSPYALLTVFSDRWLIYQSGGNPNTQMAWFDRSGRQLALVGAPSEYRWLNLSPDDSQVILERYEPQKTGSDLWLFDQTRETLTRVTASPFAAIYPLWATDGRHIAFGSNREEGFATIWQKGVNGGDEREELLCKEEPHSIFLEDRSRDGQYIVYRKTGEKTSNDLWLLPLSGDRQPKSYLATQFDERWGKVSPDGHWLAYQSSESGRYEIYVQSFPEPGRKVTVSKGGGEFPRWRRAGRELYFIAADNKLMAAPVETGANFSAGTPVPLFDVGSYGRRTNRYVYDVSADGQKILLIRPLEDATPRPLTVVQNWTALLKK